MKFDMHIAYVFFSLLFNNYKKWYFGKNPIKPETARISKKQKTRVHLNLIGINICEFGRDTILPHIKYPKMSIFFTITTTKELNFTKTAYQSMPLRILFSLIPHLHMVS